MDNLSGLKDLTEEVYDPSGQPQSITAEEVRDLHLEYLQKLGKYTGFPFTAKRNRIGNIVNVGELYWEGSAMNKSEPFPLFVSLFTIDNNNITRILDILNPGAIIHFKDFKGKTTTLEYISYDVLADTDGNSYAEIAVKGFSENSNYAYQINESNVSMLEFINKGGSAGELVATPYEKIATYSGSQIFSVEANSVITQVFYNGGFLSAANYSRIGNNITITSVLENEDVLTFTGFTTT